MKKITAIFCLLFISFSSKATTYTELREASREIELNLSEEIRPGEETDAVGRVYSTGKLNSNPCGGTLIAKNLVVTAGHCVEDILDSTQSGRKIYFVPGVEAYKADAFKSLAFEVERVITPRMPRKPLSYFDSENDLINSGDSILHQDIAFLVLSNPVSQIEPINILWDSLIIENIKNLPVTKVGYPQSISTKFRNRGQMPPTTARFDCPVTDGADRIIELGCGVEPGSSGSAVIISRDDNLYLLGIVIAGNDRKAKVLILKEFQSLIKDFLH